MEAEPRRERREDRQGDARSDTSEEDEIVEIRTAVTEAIHEAEEQTATKGVEQQIVEVTTVTTCMEAATPHETRAGLART